MQNWDEDIEKVLSALRTVAVPGDIRTAHPEAPSEEQHPADLPIDL